MEHVHHLDDIVNLKSIFFMKIDTLESNSYKNIVERNDYMNGFLNALHDIKKLVKK